LAADLTVTELPGSAPDSPDPASLSAEPGTGSAAAPTVTLRSRLAVAWRAVTNRGRAVAVVAAIAVVLGVATGWREWVGIAAALAVLLLAAVLMALGKSSCTADLELPRTRFNVGEEGWATLLIRNSASRRMLPLQMELEIHARAAGEDKLDRAEPSLAAAAEAAMGVDTSDTGPTADTRMMSIPSIPGGGSHTVYIPLPTEHRAVIVLGPLRAVRGDVFGLIRRVVQWPLHQEVYVWPRIARPTGSLPGFVRDLEGDESTIRTASDLSFHTLREYVPGDDRRFIHWKSSARNGTLQVREFLQTHRSMVAVIMSGNRDEYYWGGAEGVSRGNNHDRRADDLPADAEFELAVSCAASMVADLVRRRRDVVTGAAGTAIVGGIPDTILDRFCAVQAQPAASPDLAFATRQVLRRNPRAAVVILVFGSLADAVQVRAAFRACPPGATVLALRARVEASPAPPRLAGSGAEHVLTLPDINALPGVLRIAG
jgi:uncharacterized protein (DUF58 family)